MVSDVSSGPVPVSAPATGESLTGVMVMETVAVVLSASPSLALKVKLSAPLKSTLGV